MKTNRAFMLLLGCLLMASCSKQSKSTTPQGPGGLPAFYERIPADTPYVFASIDGYTPEMVDAMFEQFGSMYEQIDRLVEQAAAEASPDERKYFDLYRRMFKGKWNRQGFESLGFDMSGHFALYGLGLYPVMYWQLSDVDTFRKNVETVMKEVDFTPEKHRVGGSDYWILVDDEGLALAMAYTSRGVVLTVTSNKDHAWAMEYALGLKKLEKTLAGDPRTLQVAEQYDMLRTHVGIIDMRRLTQVILGDGGSFADVSRKGFGIEETVTDQCKRDYYEFTEYGPRIVVGVTDWSRAGGEMLAVWETDRHEFFRAMGSVMRPVPGADIEIDPARKAMFGIGIAFDEGHRFLLDHLAAARKDPYQCEHFDSMNEMIATAESELRSVMIPPPARGFLGTQASLYDMQFDDEGSPSHWDAALVLRHKDPDALLMLAQLAVPELASLDVPDDGSVVSQNLGDASPVPGITELHIARRGESLAVGVGPKARAALPALVSTLPDNAYLMTTGMDYSWLGQLTQRLGMGEPSPIDPAAFMKGHYTLGISASDKGLEMRARYIH